MQRKINIGLLAHVDAGKTSLTEQLLFCGGLVRAAGAVDLGTAQTDALEIERARGISVKAADAVLEAEGATLNFIDTPGHADFIGEVERALSVLDCAVLLVSAVEGVQAQTEILIDALCRLGLPCAVFVNKLDRAGSDFDGALKALAPLFGDRPLAVYNRPKSEGDTDAAPEAAADFLESCALFSEDESILERVLAGEDAPEAAEIAMRNGMVPVLCGSSKTGAGCGALLRFLARFAPCAVGDAEGEFSARVFRVEHDKALGKLCHMRIFSGSLKARQAVYLPRLDSEEKAAGLRRPLGRRHEDVQHAEAGDIVAVFGLSDVVAGDVLGRGALPDALALSVPLLSVKAVPKTAGALPALREALSALAEEDPALAYTWVPEKREIRLSILGAVQLEILEALLLERYGLEAEFTPPSVIYKETPLRPAEGFDAYTMPKPCWAILRFLLEPLPRGAGLVYESKTPNTRLLYRYQNHVAEAVPRALKQGLHGFEVTDLKVTLIDGEHHHVHTHPLDFFLCTPLAIMDGLKNAGTTLLEPILRVTMTFDAAAAGRVIGLVQNARGVLGEQETVGARQRLTAEIPVAESLSLPVDFARVTAGRGSLAQVFSHYAPCPPGFTAERERDGVNPLDRAKYILEQRNALAT